MCGDDMVVFLDIDDGLVVRDYVVFEVLVVL